MSRAAAPPRTSRARGSPIPSRRSFPPPSSSGTAWGRRAPAQAIEKAVRGTIESGRRTGDIWSEGTTRVGTREMGAAILERI